jgi:hypothetical protein
VRNGLVPRRNVGVVTPTPYPFQSSEAETEKTVGLQGWLVLSLSTVQRGGEETRSVIELTSLPPRLGLKE